MHVNHNTRLLSQDCFTLHIHANQDVFFLNSSSMRTCLPSLQPRRTRHARHCSRSKDKLMSNVFYENLRIDLQVLTAFQKRTYMNFFKDTGCRRDDLPRAIDDTDSRRERGGREMGREREGGKERGREREREIQSTLCCQREVMIMIDIKLKNKERI